MLSLTVADVEQADTAGETQQFFAVPADLVRRSRGQGQQLLGVHDPGSRLHLHRVFRGELTTK